MEQDTYRKQVFETIFNQFNTEVPDFYPLDSDIEKILEEIICNLHQFYHCVIIRGSATLVRDDTLKVDALNALIANRATGAFSENHEKAVEDLIQLVLSKIA